MLHGPRSTRSHMYRATGISTGPYNNVDLHSENPSEEISPPKRSQKKPLCISSSSRNKQIPPRPIHQRRKEIPLRAHPPRHAPDSFSASVSSDPGAQGRHDGGGVVAGYADPDCLASRIRICIRGCGWLGRSDFQDVDGYRRPC